MADLPFDRYEGGGRRLMGMPKRGDETARHGYGPPVFKLCGLRCAYCGFDMGGRYEDWLQLSVDHVVPAGSIARGFRREWVEDIANLVTCCRPCNEFSNAFVVTDQPPTREGDFFDVRDRAFIAKRQLLLAKHARERERFVSQLGSGTPSGPDLPADPTP